MPPRIAPTRGTGPTRGGPARGGGAGRGGTPAIAAHVRTIGVKRPGYGTGGRQVQTIVNAFRATVPDEVIHHYDIDINPDKLPARVNMQLFDALQHGFASNIFVKPAVYDGRKNAFTTYELRLGTGGSAKFDVTLERTAESRTDKPPKVYTIKVTKVAEINAEILHRFIAGQQSPDNAVLTAITALNIVIRMEPNLKYPFNVRSFFTSKGSQKIGGGLELYRGYFQSVRPSKEMMYINLDIATGVMYKAGSFLSLCLEYMGKDHPKYLVPRTLSDRERIHLQRFVSGMRVTTKYTGQSKTLVVKRLTAESASGIMFSMRDGGPPMSVADYFRRQLNKPLQFPDVICIEVGSAGAKIPLELCDVPPGQIMRKQIPADKTSAMVEFSKLAPAERLKSITEGLGVLQYGQSEYIREFGMNIATEPLKVKARILPPPTLRYGTTSREPTIKPRDGAWNMRDKKFFRAQTISSWAIIVYESQRRFTEADTRQMVGGFIEGALSVGMNVTDKNPPYFFETSPEGVIEHLKKAGNAARLRTNILPNLIVVVLPEGGNQIYTTVKHFGDVLMGVATQCLKSGKCRNAKLQYWANVMLKVNVKLGGINAVLDNSMLTDPNHPTVVMGADVMHPAPGTEGRPSFASLVTSVDKDIAKYVAINSVQTGRLEIIEDLKEMVMTALRRHMQYRNAVEKTNRTPTRLIFYRDGVSEGQFAHVLEQELPMIKSACETVGVKGVRITLIIVGKRHHIRMFPTSQGDADRSGNCQAGTTVDEGIGHPTEFDYYQLTHGGLLGTSRPAHYSVLYDDNNFSPDALQNLSFSLCHLYARATRSVSIPAPVYYADIACARAKNHFPPGADFEVSESGTLISPQAQELKLAGYKASYKPIHVSTERVMYFM